jgi:antitoxin (DNA-binding transcriptional repressor) of toxin-antitoxin stability system
MEFLTISQAKPRISRLVERALRGEAVVIRKGNRMVQLTEYVPPEPIPMRPAGYFRRQAADYATANAAPAGDRPQR